MSRGLKPAVVAVWMPGLKPRPISEAKTEPPHCRKREHRAL